MRRKTKKAIIMTRLRSLASLLKFGNLTVSVCESCTGGMFGSILTSLPGSSGYFYGGIIAYSNASKEKFGVRPAILLRHGAVSKKTAREMANSARELLMTDIGVGITGIAGPGGGSKNKPVGLVYIAISFHDSGQVKRHILKGSRGQIRQKACVKAMDMLIERLSKGG
jgi:nicotinamide-nucleotide amidase